MGKKDIRVKTDSGSIGFVLFTAFIGAAVYFVEQSTGFWGFWLAMLKAIVWPAYLLHAIFQSLAI